MQKGPVQERQGLGVLVVIVMVGFALLGLTYYLTSRLASLQYWLDPGGGGWDYSPSPPQTVPRPQPPTRSPLSLTFWSLESGVEAPNDPLTLRFDYFLDFGPKPTGRASGRCGCETFETTYEEDEDDGSLTFDTITVARPDLVCDPSLVEAKHTYLQALGATRSYTIDDGELVLRDGEGAILLTFSEG